MTEEYKLRLDVRSYGERGLPQRIEFTYQHNNKNLAIEEIDSLPEEIKRVFTQFYSMFNHVIDTHSLPTKIQSLETVFSGENL